MRVGRKWWIICNFCSRCFSATRVINWLGLGLAGCRGGADGSVWFARSFIHWGTYSGCMIGMGWNILLDGLSGVATVSL